MAVATKVGEGNMLDYAHTAGVLAGEIVKVVSLVLIASRKAVANEGIGWHTSGLFDFPKTAGVGTGIAFGTKVYWNDTTKVVTATASGNTAIGHAGAASGDEAIQRVRFKQDG